MSLVLDKLPVVPNNIFGVELQICVIFIAFFSILHFFCFAACPFDTIGIATSIVTGIIFFVLSILLLLAALKAVDDKLILVIWIWYTLCFIGIQVLILFIFMINAMIEGDLTELGLALLGFVWYTCLSYFILVVNEYRKSLEKMIQEKD